MKTFTHLLCVLILSIVLFACNNVHFLKEESYRNQVAQDFEQKNRHFLMEIYLQSLPILFCQSTSAKH